MKILLIQIIAMTGIIAFAACNQEHKSQKESVQEYPLPDTTVTAVMYPLNDAISDIKRYDSLLCPMRGKDTLRAFTVRNVDLLAAMGIETKTQTLYHVREYLGYHPGAGFKLFIVPVLDLGVDFHTGNAGTDYFFDINGSVVPYSGSTDNLYVLDLNAPCPRTCDEGSPLNVQYKCQ